MKLDIKLQSGSMGREHQIELIPLTTWPAQAGRVQFVLDGETREADWTEITPGTFSILLGGRSFQLHVAAHPNGQTAGGAYEISVGTRRYHVEVRDPRRRRHSGQEALNGGPQEIVAPMPGKIVKILVAENQEVVQGQGLLVIEAMKMQNELKAPRSGRVERIHVSEGAGVESGFKLIRLA
jgi:biotin carboxyl carrier protein